MALEMKMNELLEKIAACEDQEEKKAMWMEYMKLQMLA